MTAETLILDSIAVLTPEELPRFCTARYGTTDYDGLASYLCSPSGVAAACRCVLPPSPESPGVIAHGREVRLYDAAGRASHVYRLRERITSAVYSPHTRKLVTGFTMGSVWVWNLADGTQHELKGAAGSACLAVRPDGMSCACGGGTTVTVHSLSDLARTHELNGMEETIGSLHFADGGRILVAAGATAYFLHDDDDSEVVAWDIDTGAMLWHRSIDRGDTSCIWIGGDDLRVAGGGVREPAFVLDARTGENAPTEGLVPPADLLPIPAIPGSCPVSSLDASSDGTWIVTDEVLWNLTRRTPTLLPETRRLPDGVGFAAGSEAVLRLFLNGEVESYAIPSLESISRDQYANGVWRDLLVPGGEWLVAVFQDFQCAGGPEKNRIELFRASDRSHVRTIEHPLVELAGVEAGCNGDVLVGTGGGKAVVWELPSGYRRTCCKVSGGCYAAGPGGRFIAVAAPYQPAMEVVDTSTGNVVDLVDTTGTVPSNAAFSPDGRLLAIAGADWKIRLHGLGGGGTTLIEGHLGEVTRLVFARDSRTLFTGSRDFTVMAWDVVAATVPGDGTFR